MHAHTHSNYTTNSYQMEMCTNSLDFGNIMTTTTTTNVTDLLARFIHTYTDVGHSFFFSQRWTATTKTNEDNLRVVELSGTWEWIAAASTWSMFQRYLTFISALGWEYIERRALERKSWLRHIVYTQCIFHI